MRVIIPIGCKLPIYSALVDTDLQEKGLDYKKAAVVEIAASKKCTTERQIVMGLVHGSDCLCFGKPIKDLENPHTKGMESFPQTLSDTFILQNNWKSNPRNQQRYNLNEGVHLPTK